MKARSFLLISALTLFGSLAAPAPAAYAATTQSGQMLQDVDLSQSDKQIHMAVSYGIAMTSTIFFRSKKLALTDSIFFSSLITLGLGSLKEFCLDPHPSKGDLVANSIGVGANAIIATTIRF